MKKINGITQKSHPFQIMSYIFFSAIIISYFVIVFPLSSPTARIIGAILEVAFGLAVGISGYLVTVIDPSDSYRCDALKAKAEGKSYTPPSTDFRCSIEDVYVHHSSKHCKACGRCTEGFDHHCKWVNNDIGKKNYKHFFVLISNVSLFFVVFIVFGAITTANYCNDSNFSEDGKYLYKSTKQNILPAMIILWILMAITSLFFVFVTNLVLLHIFLMRKGLTTFQYITLVEERKQNQRELEIAFRAMGGQNHTCLDFVLCLKNKKKSSVPNPTENKEGDNSKEPANHPRMYTDKSRTIEKSKSNSDSDSDSDSDSSSEQSELSEQPEQARVSYQERAIFENMRQTIQIEPIRIQPRKETATDLAQIKSSKEGNVNNGGFSPVDIESGEVMRPLVSDVFYTQNKAQETENTSLLKNKKLVISLEMIEQRDFGKTVSPKKSSHNDKLLNPIHSFEQGNYYEETLSPFTNRETTSIKKIYESKSAREVSPSHTSLLIQELESAKKIKKLRRKEEAQNSISTQHYSENEIYLPFKSQEINKDKDKEKKRQELNVEVLS